MVHVSTSTDFGNLVQIAEIEPDMDDLESFKRESEGCSEIIREGKGTLEYPYSLLGGPLTPHGQAVILLNRSQPGDYIKLIDRKRQKDWIMKVTATGLRSPDNRETRFAV